jgi:hypothetical protein
LPQALKSLWYQIDLKQKFDLDPANAGDALLHTKKSPASIGCTRSFKPSNLHEKNIYTGLKNKLNAVTDCVIETNGINPAVKCSMISC